MTHRGYTLALPMLVSIPEMTQGDPIRLSASTYVAWKRCPDSANARLQGMFGPDSRPAFVGSLAHRVFSRHLNSGRIGPGQFVQTCREEIGGSTLNNKLGPLEIKPSALAGVIEEVRDLYDRFTEMPTDGFEGSEVSIEVELDEDLQLVGSVDAVYREKNGGHRLVDWKTGELGEPGDQMMFYAFLWAIDRDDVPARVEAVSVRTGERYCAVPSSADIRNVGNEVSALVNEIRAARHEARPARRSGGPWCVYCPLVEDCEEGRSVAALLSTAHRRSSPYL